MVWNKRSDALKYGDNFGKPSCRIPNDSAVALFGTFSHTGKCFAGNSVDPAFVRLTDKRQWLKI